MEGVAGQFITIFALCLSKISNTPMSYKYIFVPISNAYLMLLFFRGQETIMNSLARAYLRKLLDDNQLLSILND